MEASTSPPSNLEGGADARRDISNQSETTNPNSINQQEKLITFPIELQNSTQTTSNKSTTQVIKSPIDLKGTKTDLFNKLISSQSQQMIVTTPSNSIKNEPENLYRANSLNAHNSRKNSPNSLNNKSFVTNNKNSATSQPIKTSSTTSNNNSNITQQITLEDLKNSPVVFSSSRTRWYTNEEVAAILTNFNSHPEWQTNELKVRPKSGAVLLYSREKVRYRQDGYCWKKRKNGRTTREDHMKLKVQGIECIYGCYVHSAILPTFHRRCYWLLQNPDIVLVHYLNQALDDQNKMMITFNPSTLELDTRRSWTNEEIIEEIGSVFGGISQIQHTLNINFPQQSAAVVQTSRRLESSPIQNQTTSSTDDLDKMVESSPQSQIRTNSSTPNSITNNNSEHVYMSMIEERQTAIHHDIDKNNNDVTLAQKQTAEDELMTSSSGHHDDDNSDLDNGRLVSVHQQDGAQMRFDMNVNEFSVGDNLNSNPQNDLEFVVHGYSSVNNNNLVDDNNASLGGHENDEDSKQQQMEQNACSPVTQIYNKIVDDIETYALPLEPDQFNPNHHHHHHHHLQSHDLSISSLPMQTMDITNDSVSCDRPLTPHLGGQQQQMIGRCLENRHISQTTGRSLIGNTIEKQYRNSCETGDVIKDLATCSMDLTGCDLFSDEVVGQSGCQNRDDNQHDLLIGDFRMQTSNVENSGRVNNLNGRTDVGNNVIETLSNVDDLRDLMMTNSGENSNLLVDSNSFDLFSFKPIDCDTQTMQQLDVKSSTSDTEALARLSPMLIGCVPRCNSTGNAMHPSHFNSDYHHSQHLQHFSSNFLSSTSAHNSNPAGNNFGDFQSNLHGDTAPSQRSSSTNQSHSTSCSSTSLPRSGTPILSNSSTSHCANLVQYEASSGGPTLMKLPLQQRQNSEQQEPCNSVLSSLLPKALSLDGGDLSITNRDYNHQHYRHHRLSTSPIISYENLPERQANLLTSTPESQSSSLLNRTFEATESYQQSIKKEETNGSGRLNEVSDEQMGYSNQPNTTTSYGNRISVNSSNPLLTILDYVPNWCNITGGAKVLIVGNWNSLLNQNSLNSDVSGQRKDDIKEFAVMFDDLLVPATLIMDNVLRCYVPSHEQGFISLKVLYMDCIVSDQVLFEMRPSCTNSQSNIQVPGTSYSTNDANFRGANENRDRLSESFVSDKTHNSNILCNKNTQHQQTSNLTSSILTNTTFFSQKHQLFSEPSSTSCATVTDGNKTNRVLTLAENIISGMHRKNNHFRSHFNNSRLVNSLDIESLNHYRNLHQNRHHQSHRWSNQQSYSHKASQRSLTNSRSLSRESEPAMSSYAINYGLIESDPYWHQNSTDIAWPDSRQQPLDVQIEQQTSRYQVPRGGTGQQVQTALVQVVAQKPNLVLANSYNLHSNQPSEIHNMTETSSSGLGSIVSSLSPSPSSLQSPTTSLCCVNGLFRQEQGRQSPCSCERQSNGTPTSDDFCEYFKASAKTEESFASLTLNDKEQQELYEAAKVIQKAYRTYRGRKRQASELMVESTTGIFPEISQLNNSEFSNQLPSTSLGTSLQNNDQHSFLSNPRNFNSYQQAHQIQNVCLQQQQQQTSPEGFMKCYRDKEMQAATIIQAYYRRYRQYVHYKIQQSNNTKPSNSLQNQSTQKSTSGSSCNHRLVVEPIPVIIDTATTSHIDRKRFKTANLCSTANMSVVNQQASYDSAPDRGH